MARKVLLLTIGATPLPSVTPIIPVTTTDTVDPWTSPGVAPPTGLVVSPVVDGARIAWVKSTTVGADLTILELAPVVGGAPGAWTVEARTTEQAWSLNLPDGPRYVRVTAELNGRQSAPTLPVLAIPDIPGGAYNVNLLVNAGFRTSLAGWSQYSNTASGTWFGERDARTLSDRVAGTHNMAVHTASSPGSGSNVWASDPVSAWPGETYMASGWISRDDCLAYIRLMFFNEAGGLLSSADSAEAAAAGGTNPANWNRRFVAAEAPANARTARMALVVTANGGSAPAGFLVQPMLEHASPGQTAPSNWHMGGAEGLKVWNVRLDVNGHIAGIELANDGTQSAFTVAADEFSVVKAGGGDALTWSGGVLSADKGSKAVKIGAGFGSDAAGKKLVFAFGDGGSPATRSRANSRLFIAENGDVKLGAVQVNFGSSWSSGAAITYTASPGTPATATISVTAGIFNIGSDAYSYAASSANVTGTDGTTTVFYLYYDDPGMDAGVQTLHASTDPTVHYTDHGHVVVGAVAVVFPATGAPPDTGGGSTPGGGGGGGGGGGYCPHVDAWVLTRRGPIRAGEVAEGEYLLLCDPDTGIETWGRVSYSRRKRCSGVRMRAAGASLTCSRTAPIPTDQGYRNAPDTLGLHVPTRRGAAFATPVVEAVEDVGLIDVQHITVGDRCYWVGDDCSTFFLHHNLKAYDPMDP